MSDLTDLLRELSVRVAELERRNRNAERTGTITEVDAAKGLAKVKLSDDLTTGWIPWEEQALGAAKTHFPPSVGQQVKLRSQSGDLSDATIAASVPSDTNQRASTNGNEIVPFDYGGVRMACSGGSLTITASGVTVVIGSGGLAITGGQVTHDSKNIGSTHKHGGVEVGASQTDHPE